MYKVLGGDGKQYGPVSADTLRQWINQGRANAQTQVQAEGTADWVPLGACPEFAAIFSEPPAGTPAPIGSPPGIKPRTSGMAITSLVMGILSFISCGLTFIITSPLGLILGLVAMSKIKKSQGQLGGWGLALAGTIVSGVSLLMLPIWAAMLLPALAKAKTKAQSINCMNNARTLGLAARIYSSDNSDKFPAATNWCDAILSNAGSSKAFVCPGRPEDRCGYAYNALFNNMDVGKADPNTVIFFESDAGWNASGGKELLITKPRHGNGYIFGFADGHCEVVMAARLSQLRWDPNPAVSSPKY